MTTSASRMLVLMAILRATTIPVVAQKTHKINHLVDSLLSKRYWRADIDTNYIIRPQTKWTLTARLNMSGSRIRTDEKDNGLPVVMEVDADNKATLTVGVSYMGMSLNLSLNPSKLLGKYKDTEFGFKSYGRRFGFDFAYQDAQNFKGWYEEDGNRTNFKISEGTFRVQTLNMNAYYVFNYRKFSYPAAFSHSYIQRRSAGSFLLAASGQGQKGEILGSEKKQEYKMSNFGIGAGYGYNYVPGKGWLLHISSLPTFIVYTNSSITQGDYSHPIHYVFPEFIITARGAVVKQIGRNMFAGLSVMHSVTTIGDKDELAFRNIKWQGHLYFGYRL